MALSPDDQANLRKLLGARFPKSDDVARDFFSRIEYAVNDYRLLSSLFTSATASDKKIDAECRRVVKHAEVLVRFLDGDGAFPKLIALELLPTRMIRERDPLVRLQHLREQEKVRRAALADIQASLKRLTAATKGLLEAPGLWGKQRGRGRRPGLLALQVKLAAECCEALHSIKVRPQLSVSKRERWVKDREAEYPKLLKWALVKAGRRTTTGRHVTGDVPGIALDGLKLFEASL